MTGSPVSARFAPREIEKHKNAVNSLEELAALFIFRRIDK